MAEIYCVMENEACLPAGTILQLSDTQVCARQRQVRPLAGGWFIALVPLWFQQGDVMTLRVPLEATWASPFTPPELRKPVIGHPNQRPRALKV